jgi:hypothetical protein
MCVILILAASLFSVGRCDTLMYPFGSSQGDTALGATDDDGAGPLQLSIGFPFYNTSYSSLYVSLPAFPVL